MKNILKPPIYSYITTKVMINHHFPRVFLWFYGFPMVFPWFSHGFPLLFPWFFSRWIPRGSSAMGLCAGSAEALADAARRAQRRRLGGHGGHLTKGLC